MECLLQMPGDVRSGLPGPRPGAPSQADGQAQSGRCRREDAAEAEDQDS